jgi:hypothetical protein
MADEPETPEGDVTNLWLQRMRRRQQESYGRLVEQQAAAEKRFGEISNEIFDDIMGNGEKKEATDE